MRLFELGPQNPIDKELARTAKGAADNGSLDPNDQQEQPDGDMGGPMGGPGDPGMDQNQPDDPMGGMQEPEPQAPTKPVDSALMAQVRGHDYIQDFDHTDPASPSNPVVIMGLDMDELSQLRNRARVMLDQIAVSDDIGKYSQHKTRAAQSLLAFVDIVMAYKKGAVRDQNQKAGGRPKVKQVPEPKTKAGNFKQKNK
jgi:hypothetical protein